MAGGLATAVPMWLFELDLETDAKVREATAVEWLADAVQLLTRDRPVLQTGGADPRDAPEAFNRLAKGVAVLSCSPGGFVFLGVLFCARHCRAGRPPAGALSCCPQCLSEKAGMYRPQGRG